MDQESVEEAPKFKFDQIIYLQDFPKTVEDMQALLDVDFFKLNGINLIEEIFNREIEDENDLLSPEEALKVDELRREEEKLAAEGSEDNEPKKPEEKLVNRMFERVVTFENIVKINNLIKN